MNDRSSLSQLIFFNPAPLTFLSSPPKIRTVRVMENPFPDIIPRITAEEKRAQQRAREAGQREREEEMRRRGAKK